VSTWRQDHVLDVFDNLVATGTHIALNKQTPLLRQVQRSGIVASMPLLGDCTTAYVRK